MTPQLPLRPNVCMLLYNRDFRLLLGERSGFPGHWQFPQGGAEPELSLVENVKKELNEEVGLPAAVLGRIEQMKATYDYDWDDPPGYARGRWRGQSQTFWSVEFLGSDTDIRLDTHAQIEFVSFRWCTVEEVRTVAAPRRVAAYRDALEEFEQFVARQTNSR